MGYHDSDQQVQLTATRLTLNESTAAVSQVTLDSYGNPVDKDALAVLRIRCCWALLAFGGLLVVGGAVALIVHLNRVTIFFVGDSVLDNPDGSMTKAFKQVYGDRFRILNGAVNGSCLSDRVPVATGQREALCATREYVEANDEIVRSLIQPDRGDVLLVSVGQTDFSYKGRCEGFGNESLYKECLGQMYDQLLEDYIEKQLLTPEKPYPELKIALFVSPSGRGVNASGRTRRDIQYNLLQQAVATHRHLRDVKKIAVFAMNDIITWAKENDPARDGLFDDGSHLNFQGSLKVATYGPLESFIRSEGEDNRIQRKLKNDT